MRFGLRNTFRFTFIFSVWNQQRLQYCVFTYVTLNCETRSLNFFQVINKSIILGTFLLSKRIHGSSHLPIFPAIIEIDLRV